MALTKRQRSTMTSMVEARSVAAIAQLCRRARMEAERLSAGQSICAVSERRQFRAIHWRVKAGRLEVVDLHGEHDYAKSGQARYQWLLVDLDPDGKPMLYDERGCSLV
jgi:hypothetical protein